MAPIDTKNTATWYLNYTSGLQEHALCFRSKDAASEASVLAFCDALVAILRIQMYAVDNIANVERRAKGSPYRFIVKTYGLAGQGAGSIGAGEQTQFYSWTGRSTGGRDVRMTFFTGIAPADANFRVPLGANSFVDAVLGTLADYEDVLCAIDGLGVIWNPYANVGFNAYWQREARES